MLKLKKKKAWSLVVILMLLVCCYVGVYHAHRYFGFNWLLWLVVAGVLCLLALSWMWLNDGGKRDKLKSYLLVLLVGGPIAVFVIFMHKSFVEKQLAEHGVETLATVTKLRIERSKNGRTPYAVFSYKLHNKIWTQEVINRESVLEVGDTIRILCADNDPEIFERL